jgi:hypothetical protein
MALARAFGTGPGNLLERDGVTAHLWRYGIAPRDCHGVLVWLFSCGGAQ